MPCALLPFRRRPRAALRAAFRLVALALLAAVSSLPATALAAQLRLAIGDRVAHALLADAVARGEFESEELEVTLVRSADPVAAIADGEADLAAVTADALLGAGSYALEPRGALLLGFALDGEAVLGAPGVRSVVALRDRPVAWRPGSTGELLLGHALQRVGLSLEDVIAVPLDTDPAAVAAALADGTLAAAALADPALLGVEAALGATGDTADGSPAAATRLASGADRPGLVTDVLAGDERWLAGNRDTVKRVIRAWNRAVGRVRRDPVAAVAALVDAFDVPPEGASRALAGFRPLDVVDNIELTRGEYQGAFSAMSETLERRERVNARGVPSANRYLSLAALRQVAAGR